MVLIYLLTAIGLTPDGSITEHIHTQTLSRQLVLNITHWFILNSSGHRTKTSSHPPSIKILSFNTQRARSTSNAVRKPTNSSLLDIKSFISTQSSKTPNCTLASLAVHLPACNQENPRDINTNIIELSNRYSPL